MSELEQARKAYEKLDESLGHRANMPRNYVFDALKNDPEFLDWLRDLVNDEIMVAESEHLEEYEHTRKETKIE